MPKVPKKPVISHLNINSLRNKFQVFKELILNETDVFLMSESKLNNIYPNAQFQVERYRLFRKDRNKYGGGIILFVKENIPARIINEYKFPASIEIICCEFSICNKKLLLGTSFLGHSSWDIQTPSQSKQFFLIDLKLAMAKISNTYENSLVIDDFNMTPENKI